MQYQLANNWLGREDSNLRMAEFKNPNNLTYISMRVPKIAEIRRQSVQEVSEYFGMPRVQLRRPLPSEGRGQGFESLRVRQSFQWLS